MYRISIIKHIVFAGIIMCLQAFSNADCSAETIVLATANSDTKREQWYRLVYRDAFKRLGYKFELRDYPTKRCAVAANNGSIDGVPERVADFNSVYQNLIRVEVPLWPVNFTAYAADKQIKLNGWESLKGTNYRVNYRLGVKKCEEMLHDIVTADNLETVNSPISGFKKLLHERAEIYVDVEFVADALLRKSSEFSPEIIFRAGVMESNFNYLFLHKKHKNLIGRIEKILREMKAKGQFDDYEAMGSKNN